MPEPSVTSYRKKGECVKRRIAGETILVPIRGTLADMEVVFALDPVSEWIWDRLSDIALPEQIARELASEFAIDMSQALCDTLEFLRELEAANLVTAVNA